MKFVLKLVGSIIINIITFTMFLTTLYLFQKEEIFSKSLIFALFSLCWFYMWILGLLRIVTMKGSNKT